MNDTRRRWLEERRRLEDRLRQTRNRSSAEGERRVGFEYLVGPLVSAALTVSGLRGRARANAHAPVLTRRDLHLPGLPPAFDGYRILLATDLHVGPAVEPLKAAARLAAKAAPDLLLLGGDYQNQGKPSAAETAHLMAPLLDAVSPPDGMVAVLGNHDRHDMAEALERRGVRVLINEWLALRRGEDAVRLFGADDVHSFHTPATVQAMGRREGFAIALVHTAELATEAAEAGFALYLSGHTHGGQVCLPGGKPLLTMLDRHRHLASGVWEWRGMKGYTSTGVGTGEPPVRFNCPGEVALITLVRA